MINSAPYFNTHSDANNYLQVLFRPEYEIQSRELNELQSICQTQTARLGKHIFKSGQPVTGGELTYKIVWYAKLAATYLGNPININEFYAGRKIIERISGVDTGKTATIIHKEAAVSGDPNTIYFIYDGEETNFSDGSTLIIDGTSLGAIISGASSLGRANYLGVNDGVWFIDPYFVFIPSQQIVLDKYTTNSTGKVGFEYTYTIVDEIDDVNLNDVAQGSPNEGAPGAHRLAISANIKYFPTGNVLPNNFFSVLEVERGTNRLPLNKVSYSDLAKEFARRTFDESGDYTVRAFKLNLDEDDKNYVLSITRSGTTATVFCSMNHGLSTNAEITVFGETGPDASLYNGYHVVSSVIDDKTFTYTMIGTPAANAVSTDIFFERLGNYGAVIGPGKGYVQGYEYETIANTNIYAPRARTYSTANNYGISAAYGNYTIVKNISGNFDTSILGTVNLYSTNNGTGTVLGTARLRYVRYHSGAYGNANLRFRFYLYDFSLTSGSFETVRSIKHVANNALAVIAEEAIFNTRAQLYGQNYNSMLFSIPQSTVKTLQPTGVPTLSYNALVKLETVASGSVASFSVTGNSSFIGPSSGNFANSDDHLFNYFLIDKTSGTPVTVSNIQLSGANKTVTMAVSPSGANIAAYINVQQSGVTQKTKTLSTSNVTINSGVITTAARKYDFSLADILSVKIYDSEDSGVDATESDLDITNRFTLDNGQRDNFYDYGSVTLNQNAIPPIGRVLIVVKYFSHSGNGFFSVDSYAGIDYKDIPSYSLNGAPVPLSDVIDFRPRRGASTHTGNAFPAPNSAISADYQFYLPRRDIVIINGSDGTFQIIQGKAELNPKYPSKPEGSMVLYKLGIPAYTFNATDIIVSFVENKRYTMRDIGVIEKRVDRLEYYQALSLLEMDTKSKSITDENGFERFKNGILVDGFTSYATADVYSGDYRGSMDYEKGTFRAPFVSKSVKLNYESASNLTYLDTELGKFATLPFTTEAFITNNFASKAQSVTPYLVINFAGVMTTVPASDDWVDTSRRPDLLTNIAGTADNWELLANAMNEGFAAGFGTQWNDWETTWTGTNSTGTGREGDPSRLDDIRILNGPFNPVISGSGVITNTTTTTETRTGTATSVTFNTTQTSLGDKLVDTNIVYYMRAVDIAFTARSMRPNRDLHVFFDGKKANQYVTADSGYEASSEGSCRSDSAGIVKGIISIPSGIFRTGDRIITITDEANNVETNSTTNASYVFASSGFLKTVQETIVSTRVPELTTRTVTENRTITTTEVIRPPEVFNPPTGEPFLNEGGGGGSGGGADPQAQTFFVPEGLYPYGIYLKSVKVFFRQKGTKDIEIHLRPTVNGFPHSRDIIPLSRVVKTSAEINVPTDTDDIAEIRAAGTTFTFPVPIYLSPGEEYSFVVYAPDPDYEIYISEMGQKVIGTDQIITQQGCVGSNFKSQNQTTWTPFQNEDIMFEMTKAVWTPGAAGTIICDNEWEGDVTNLNLFKYTPSIINIPPATEFMTEYAAAPASTGVLSSYAEFVYDTNINLPVENSISAADKFKVRSTLKTNVRDVAPLMDLTRNSVICVQNLINNLGLLKSGFVILDGGTGYSTTPTITISGGNGGGATVTPVMQSGVIVDLNVTNPGNLYTTNPTIVVSGGGGSGASIIYRGMETDSHGGNALVRYMTRSFSLADDFETNYISVYGDVYTPSGTNIRMFYKVLAADDPTVIGDRPWIEMKRKTNINGISGAADQFLETLWVPPNDDLSYTSNGATFNRAKTVQFKAILLSSNSSVIPELSSFRAITTINE